MHIDPTSPLPEPGSEMIKKLFPNYETQVVYGVLFDSRECPLRMQEIRAKVEGILGRANEHTDRRLRDTRTYFRVTAERVPTSLNEYVYRLEGWRKDAGTRTQRTKIPGSVEAAVIEAYGARCAHCGKSPKEDGVRLVIDHKIPLELGGTNDVENLQLLCTYHNHIKQARFAEYDEYTDALRVSINLDEPHLRIGELLKALQGKAVPVDLINLVAREENRGDPTRRLRELKPLGWDIRSTRRKEGRRTISYYVCRHWEPWPPEGPRAAINRLEADRKRKRRREEGDEGLPGETPGE
jgi:5-methylcytosine-specific restriction endonuclease McrA